MSAAYENQRVEFQKIAKKYREYLDLYAFFNNGSKEGATSFDDFYWRHTYLVNYENGEVKHDRGH